MLDDSGSRGEGSSAGLDDVPAIRLRHVLAAVVLAALAAGVTIRPDLAREYLFFNGLQAKAETLIDGAMEKNALLFAGISGIKSVIALIEGSSIGVGFDLEVGDLVQPAYDYIDFFWRVFLYALLVLGFYKLLLETGIVEIGFYFITASFLIWAAAAVWPRAQVWARRWGRILFVVGLMVVYIVPVTLIGSDAVAGRYLNNVKARNEERIEAVRTEIRSAQDDFLDLREKISVLNPGESLEQIRNSAMTITSRVSNAVWGGMFAFITTVVVLMTELLLIPFLSALVIYKCMAAALRRLDRSVFETRDTA